MELLIKFTRIRGDLLPVNYQYALASWIYKVISRADTEYATFLHDQGFTLGRKQFKMFTFSQLDFRPYKILGDRIQLLGNTLSLTVRFLVDSSMENFIKGLFLNQHCGLGNRESRVDFQVVGVEAKPRPVFNTTMRYECLSPIVISAMRDDGSTAYLSPQEMAYRPILIQNLIRKHKALALHGGSNVNDYQVPDYSFRLLGEPRKKGTLIKEGTSEATKVIAYLFRFELTAPVELHEVGYYAGMGEKNSMGFGCVNSWVKMNLS